MMMIKQFVKDLTYPILKSHPDFLIIGAQKAGTTSLYNYLIQHPQVIGNNSWKEIRYFDLPENYSQGMSWYLGNFPSKFQKGNKLTLDASPSYLYFKYVPALIKQDLGNIKMIAILREPVSRAYSAWQMYHSFGTNPNVSENNRKIADERTFGEAIDQELNGKCKPNIYPYDYVGRGKYIEQLENYCNYFGKENLLVLNFKDLYQDLPSLLNRVCRFLNLDPFSEEIIQKIQAETYNTGKYKAEKTPQDEQTLDKLKHYFAPYNEKLYDFLGYSYNW